MKGSGTRAAARRTGTTAALAALLVALSVAAARGETKLPPAPGRWVTDEAGVLSRAAASAIDLQLEAFEKEQGTQILVAIFRKLPEDQALEDWTQRVAQAWRVGRAEHDDGAVLFVFVDDRELRIEVGYGLEGALTDLESKAILEEVLIPQLREGDWDGGVAAAADAMIEAVRGEYRPATGASYRRRGRVPPGQLLFFAFVVFLFVVLSSRFGRRGRWRSGNWGGGGFGGGRWGGGGFGGGGFGGGGGFSGGGGSFGGGGASGRW
ncbi:MAG TPA: TPM domain-containing protein [Thermoanaerobaculia bacterium]|nr:TPM domain-containing protein [Thermoanaerobaculia bacterium]